MGASEWDFDAHRMTADDIAHHVAHMERHAVGVALSSLGQQLTIAAGLTAAWLNGWKRGYNTCADNWSGDSDRHWRPGCGKQAPP